MKLRISRNVAVSFILEFRQIMIYLLETLLFLHQRGSPGAAPTPLYSKILARLCFLLRQSGQSCKYQVNKLFLDHHQSASIIQCFIYVVCRLRNSMNGTPNFSKKKTETEREPPPKIDQFSICSNNLLFLPYNVMCRFCWLLAAGAGMPTIWTAQNFSSPPPQTGPSLTPLLSPHPGTS